MSSPRSAKNDPGAHVSRSERRGYGIANTKEVADEHSRWSTILTRRADALDAALRAEGLSAAPWDGGFFVAILLDEPFAVAARLQAEGVFVVPMKEGLRVGVCGLKVTDAPRFAAALRKCLAA